MGEVLRLYGPSLLAWALFLARRRHETGARRCVRWIFLGLAVSQTALIPAVYTALERFAEIPHVARLISHGSMLFVAWAAQEFLARMDGRPRAARWHLWWIMGAFAMMCALLALTPDLLPQAPWTLEYCVVYAAGQAPALVNVVRLGLRYAGLSGDPAVAVGLRLVAAGTAGALVYLINKIILTAASRFDFAYPLGRMWLVAKLLPSSAHLLVLLGAAAPVLLGWLRRYRLHRRLRPLWRDLYLADPTIALDPPTVPDVLALTRLRLRLYRRVIEIRDGLLTLRPYRDADIALAATERATDAGLRGRELEAAVEAATIAAALRSKADGAPPALTEAPIIGGGDLDSDTTFLDQVARAYRGLPGRAHAHQPFN